MSNSLAFARCDKVPGVQDEVGLMGKGVDLIRPRPGTSGDVRIGWLVESDVAVADLDKGEVLRVHLLGLSSQQAGYRHASRKAPHHARASPLHAFQEAAPVDVTGENARHAVLVVFDISHSKSLSVAASVPLTSHQTWRGPDLFPGETEDKS